MSRAPKWKVFPWETKQRPQDIVDSAISIAPIAVIGETQTTKNCRQLHQLGRCQGSHLEGWRPFPLPFPLDLFSMDWRVVAKGVWPWVCGFIEAPTVIHMALCASWNNNSYGLSLRMLICNLQGTTLLVWSWTGLSAWNRTMSSLSVSMSKSSSRCCFIFWALIGCFLSRINFCVALSHLWNGKLRSAKITPFCSDVVYRTSVSLLSTILPALDWSTLITVIMRCCRSGIFKEADASSIFFFHCADSWSSTWRAPVGSGFKKRMNWSILLRLWSSWSCLTRSWVMRASICIAGAPGPPWVSTAGVEPWFPWSSRRLALVALGLGGSCSVSSLTWNSGASCWNASIICCCASISAASMWQLSAIEQRPKQQCHLDQAWARSTQVWESQNDSVSHRFIRFHVLRQIVNQLAHMTLISIRSCNCSM